jgi:uncharacterized protein YuzE
MKAKYDESVDAMYIELKETKPKIVDKTIALNEDLIVDFDKDKKIIGIEILNASKNLIKKELEAIKAVC